MPSAVLATFAQIFGFQLARQAAKVAPQSERGPMFSHKIAESFPGRNFYKGKGVEWHRFLPWLLAAFVVAAILAEGMAFLFSIGQYYIFFVPLIAAVCVFGMITLAVNKGHCRSVWIGGLAGLCAGVVLYVGYFYFGMIHDFGPIAAGHPEVLPKYIRLRMRVERTHDVGDSHHDDDEQKAPTAGNTYANWGRDAFEFGLVLLITTGAGLKRARKPYCETCRRWMTREFTQFNPGIAANLMESLRNGSARSLAALCAEAPFATIPNLSLAADFCPSMKDGRSRDCATYVSAKFINTAPKGAVFDTFEQSKGKMLVRGLQLNPDELAALAPRFKVFETVAGRSAVTALMPEPPAEDAVGDKSIIYAEITPAPADQSGQVLSRKTKIIANLFSFALLIGFFAGMGLMLGGIFLAFPDHPPAEGISPATKLLGIILITFGGMWLCVSMAITFIDSSMVGTRYARKVLLQELSRRTSLMVDPNDPDAIFVESVPKMNWGKMMLDNAGDVGLLVVDQQKREIRFEGDKERWRIPAAAITYSQFEVFVQQQGHSKTKYYYAVVRVNHRGGFWEAPIRPRGKTGLFSGRRKKATRRLFEAIETIRGVKEPDMLTRV
jgi:hypothetical protein